MLTDQDLFNDLQDQVEYLLTETTQKDLVFIVLEQLIQNEYTKEQKEKLLKTIRSVYLN